MNFGGMFHVQQLFDMRVCPHCLREIEESSSNRSSLPSVGDSESIYISYGLLPSKLSDGDCFLSISPRIEVLPCCPAKFEAGYSHADIVTGKTRQ